MEHAVWYGRLSWIVYYEYKCSVKDEIKDMCGNLR